MQGVINSVEKILQYLLIVLTAAIVICVSWQVFSRYILQSPSSLTEELARFLLIWIGLFGAAYAYKCGSHLGLDILTTRMKPLQQKFAAIFSNLVVLFFAVYVMMVGGMALVNLTMDPTQTSAAMEIKMGYVYSAVPLSGLLIAIFSCEKIIGIFCRPLSQLQAETSVLGE
nr:TRAP transporter small permease [Catenovulum maritimum]